ncbi:MAG: hypothetical protein K2L51_06975, partial [Clostridiales bacterium]|nr:hypothetical protein [Clostridiales bacterium]
AVGFAVIDIVWAGTHHFVSDLFVLLPVLFALFSLVFCGLGVLGAYIKKIFYESKSRPVYLVRETEKDLHARKEEKNAAPVTDDAWAEVAATVALREDEEDAQ